MPIRVRLLSFKNKRLLSDTETMIRNVKKILQFFSVSGRFTMYTDLLIDLAKSQQNVLLIFDDPNLVDPTILLTQQLQTSVSLSTVLNEIVF